LLKTDLKQLQELYRPPELDGVMIFNSVNWDKQKLKVTGAFKEKVYKCKTWYNSWHCEALSPGVNIVIAIAASFVGANIIAPYFTQGLIAWKAVLIKAGISTLTQRLAISVAANGGNL